MSKIKLSILGSLLMTMVIVNTYLTYNKFQENIDLKRKLIDTELLIDNLLYKIDSIKNNQVIIYKEVPVSKEKKIISKEKPITIKKDTFIKKENNLYNLIYCDTTVIKQNLLGIFNTTLFKINDRYMVVNGISEADGTIVITGYEAKANKTVVNYINKMPILIFGKNRYKLSDDYLIKDVIVNRSTESSIEYGSIIRLTFTFKKEAI